jgi:hypothetical protein
LFTGIRPGQDGIEYSFGSDSDPDWSRFRTGSSELDNAPAWGLSVTKQIPSFVNSRAEERRVVRQVTQRARRAGDEDRIRGECELRFGANALRS